MRQRFVGAALAAILAVVAVWIWTAQQRPEPPPAAVQPVNARPVEMPAPAPVVFASEYYRDVKPILDRRCLVCHGCYDAPCQLKLDSPEGLQRGATPQKVYDGTRLLPAPLTRLFVDAQTTAEWRDKGFHAVLNEGESLPADNLENSLLYQMLMLKQQHPLPEGNLPAEFDGADRPWVCPRPDQFAAYAEKRPLHGMPFGFPGLDRDEFETIRRWLETGAAVAPLPPLPAALQKNVAEWERFLNNDDLKSQLMARYLFEHLFHADLYFDAREPRQFFRLVRSRTAPGQPIDVVASRRPIDDPDLPRVYYRLQPVHASIVAKTHLPYLLDGARMARWRELFLQVQYSLERLPSYAPDVAGNPFVAFAALPVQSRYRFLLDDAGFFIRGFVKSPVCRGQVALNVLQDQFWVAFANPDLPAMVDADFLARASGDLRLPAEIADRPFGIAQWQDYANRQAVYLAAKDDYLREKFGAPRAVTFDLLWNGDGKNRHAALTVFRHFDSASVVEGLVGDTPKTAWVVDYPMFERIHYLLVAGFDVYGDASHHLLTRLYMDYLRMEGEANFLAFLPKALREAERNSWYRGVGAKLRDSVYGRGAVYRNETGIEYQTSNPKREFFQRWGELLGPALARHEFDDAKLEPAAREALQRIARLRGWPAAHLPELSYLRLVIRGAPDQVFTLVRNADHDNVAVLLLEKARRRPQGDTVTLLPGIVGAYPNAFWVVRDSDLPQFSKRLASLDGPTAYRRLQRDFSIARNDPKFWQHSDWLHNIYRETDPVEWGVLDYSRYQK